MHTAIERLRLRQRVLLGALDLLEAWVVPALRHGRRRRLIAWIGRAQAHIKPCANEEDSRRYV